MADASAAGGGAMGRGAVSDVVMCGSMAVSAELEDSVPGMLWRLSKSTYGGPCHSVYG